MSFLDGWRLTLKWVTSFLGAVAVEKSAGRLLDQEGLVGFESSISTN